jgi:hypothetical protein
MSARKSKPHRRKAGAAQRRPSRALLNKLLVDLSERIRQHIKTEESIIEAHKPLGDHIVSEHHVRTVFNVLLERQLGSLRNIAGLTDILCELSERGRPKTRAPAGA